MKWRKVKRFKCPVNQFYQRNKRNHPVAPVVSKRTTLAYDELPNKLTKDF